MIEILRKMVRNVNGRESRVKSQKGMDYQPDDANRSTLFSPALDSGPSTLNFFGSGYAGLGNNKNKR